MSTTRWRALMLALLLLGTAVAGCLGTTDDDAGDDGAGDGNDGGQDDGAGDGAGPGTNTTDDQVNVQESHDFTTSTGTATAEFEIPSDAGPYDVRMSFSPPSDAPVCSPGNATISLITPDGEVAEEIGGLAVSTGATCGDQVQKDGQFLPPGTWTIRFSGTGVAVGNVDIQN